MKRNRPSICGLSLTVFMAIVLIGLADEPRPVKWAQPIKVEGVENLYKVSDTLYRSAQPTRRGMKSLKKLGIETVISLRAFHSDRDEIGWTGLGYEHIPMKAWNPDEWDVGRFLQIVTNPKRTPVLVHCKYGSDRTGLMCGIYRIVVQGWTPEDAVEEMKEGGYGFNEVFYNLVKWLRDLDVDGIKKKAGLAF